MQPGSTEKLTLDWSLYVIAPVGVDIDTLGGMFKDVLLLRNVGAYGCAGGFGFHGAAWPHFDFKSA